MSLLQSVKPPRFGVFVPKLTAVLAVLMGLLCAQQTRAEPLQFTLDEARLAASRALEVGEPAAALVLAKGVMLGAPEDVPAHILKSRALRDLNRLDEAEQSGRTAWALAANDRERFFAALAIAQAKASNGKEGVAQFWLRRAAQIAPSEDLRQLAIRDFRFVRRVNPLSLTFGVTAAPTNNINGAPKTNTFAINDFITFVNPSAVPLSGTRYGVEGNLRYTLHASPRSRLHFDLGGERQRAELSSEARKLVPAARNKDFAVDRLDTGINWDFVGGQGKWILQSGFGFSRNWSASEIDSDARRYSLALRRAFNAGWELGGRVRYEQEVRHSLRLRDAQTRDLTLHVQKSFSAGYWMRLDLSKSKTVSNSAAVSNSARRAGFSFGLSKPVAGLIPQLTISYQDVDFTKPLYGLDPRQDETIGLSANVLMSRFEYLGFAPEIGVSYRDRSSNFSLFESEGTDWRMGIRSVF